MPVTFEEAYLNAQRSTPPDVWAYLSDADRMRAIRDQMYRINIQEALARAESHLPTSRRMPLRRI